ncbi:MULTISPECIES: hypothetical protein [Niastella]|uniref:DUF1735 domain-containing protein n=1 Tax=Niastella soli TaxID=2821487 RepID=A0ABS3YMR7_9BACT|nr:hypothetical protein [Niastella soli]MBO9199185.1 hypothetical protein [Niastella soli]
MKFRIYTAVLGLSAAVALALNGCAKQETDPLMDARPEVSVTFPNAKEFRPDPTVYCSLNDSIIQIELSIPASSGKTITEISKIASGTSYTKIQSNDISGWYVGTPIPATGTSVTYKTTLKEYFAFTKTTSVKANTELANKFYFSVKLNDGSQLVTMPVRVYVLPKI